MNRYAILANPGHNRVYFEASKKLSLAELTLALQAVSCSYSDLKGETLAGVFYISFQTEAPLDEGALSVVAGLSFLYAFFEWCKQGELTYLRPIDLPQVYYMDGGLSSILKYSGKTNELFTRMLLHVALLSSPYAGSPDPIRVLDPIAGKGTTLYESLMRGYAAYGIEIGEKAVSEAYQYFKKYLETEKYKHTTDTLRISGAEKCFTAKRYTIQFAKTKGEWKDKPQHWELVSGNSQYASDYFKKNFFHLIVGDLPYGVQHGNVTQQKQSSFTRNPSELVSACAESWYRVLKPGGVLVLSWNQFVLPREKFTLLLEQAGFSVLQTDPYLSFAHRVDQAIRRDLIVAKKPL